MPKYKLRRSFYNGAEFYRAGAVVELEEGQAPSSAIPVEEAAAAPAPQPEPELDLAPNPVDAKPGDTLTSLGKKK